LQLLWSWFTRANFDIVNLDDGLKHVQQYKRVTSAQSAVSVTSWLICCDSTKQ
jgi:hypothetical protein